MLKCILMDIEGTTSAIDFVHKVLFPYASQKLQSFILSHIHDPPIQDILFKAASALNINDLNEETIPDLVKGLKSWIDQDLKHPALKALQGYIWEAGYKQQDYTGHIYDDVLPNWQLWRTRNLKLAIYSSGSIKAQKLLYQHTEYGDLTAYLSAYFDTTTGPKKQQASYKKIADILELNTEEILFLSDAEQELSAAQEAGMQTIQIVRPGTPSSEKFATASDFNAISETIPAHLL